MAHLGVGHVPSGMLRVSGDVRHSGHDFSVVVASQQVGVRQHLLHDRRRWRQRLCNKLQCKSCVAAGVQVSTGGASVCMLPSRRDMCLCLRSCARIELLAQLIVCVAATSASLASGTMRSCCSPAAPPACPAVPLVLWACRSRRTCEMWSGCWDAGAVASCASWLKGLLLGFSAERLLASRERLLPTRSRKPRCSAGFLTALRT